MMSTFSQYIGDTDVIARFRVRQLRVAVVVYAQPTQLVAIKVSVFALNTAAACNGFCPCPVRDAVTKTVTVSR